MADEAKTLIDQAMQTANHDIQVEKCLSAIIERQDQEKARENALMKDAGDKRKFFVKMGHALNLATPSVTGRWRFPFGEMPLTITSDKLTGTLNVPKTESRLAALLTGVGGGSSTPKTEAYNLEGRMKGAVCEFEIIISDTQMGTSGMAYPILAGSPKKSGFIVFEADARSATYAELAGRTLGKLEELTRVDR